MNMVLNVRGEFLKTVAATGTPERLTSRSITSIVRDGTSPRCVVTITAHGFINGAVLHISGAAQPEFNVLASVVGIKDANSVYVNIPGVTAAATGTLVCYADIFVTQVTVLGKKGARTANAGSIFLGINSANDAQAVEVLTNTDLTMIAVDQAGNLANWYVDVATAGDGAYVLYT